MLEYGLIISLIIIVCTLSLSDVKTKLHDAVTCSVKVFVPEFVPPISCA